jgi:hypothetical protein
MNFIPGHFYRFKRRFHAVTRSSLKVGDVYRFEKQTDFFPVTKIEFIFMNAMGDEFDLLCAYEALDNVRLEDVFEEVPMPTWWTASRQPAAE